MGVCYRAPNSNLELFMNFVECSLTSLGSGGGDVVVCGDFNLDLLRVTENPSS